MTIMEIGTKNLKGIIMLPTKNAISAIQKIIDNGSILLIFFIRELSLLNTMFKDFLRLLYSS